ncbi:MAG: hypothetical protein ACYTF8_02255, partial [Planctomycetota bacterium]
MLINVERVKQHVRALREAIEGYNNLEESLLPIIDDLSRLIPQDTVEEMWDKCEELIGEALREAGQGACHVRYSVCTDQDSPIPVDRIAVPGVNWVRLKYGPLESEPLLHPTWLQVAVVMNDFIVKSGDYHHCFLEGLKFEGVEPFG